MRTLTRKLLTAGITVTAVGVVHAEEPAPTVRIARVTAGPIARGAAPDDRPASQAMPGWLAGPTSTAVRPLTGAEQAAAASVAPVKKPSLADSTFSGVKGFLSPGPTPGQVPTPTPLPQGMQPPAAQSAASPGVYAGPPAYRWYGYGAVTPGRNPHAPEGVSPRGSPNWYAQSGATPGAFPVTVTANGQIASGQPVVPRDLPSYTLGHVASSFDRPAEQPATPVPTPVTVPTTAPGGTQPLPATVTAGVEAASLATPFAPPEPTPTPLPVMSSLPVMAAPAAEPQPSLTPTVTPPPRLSEPPAFNPTAAGPPAPTPAPDGPQPLLTWSSTSTDPAVTFTGSKSPTVASVAAVSPPPAMTVTPTTATVTSVTPAVVPASAAVSVTPIAPAVTTPTWGAAKPRGRSQGPADPAAPTLDQAIRNAAYGFATVAEVRHTGPSAVTVRLQAATAADARSAAELVSKLPALKPLSVEFVVTISAPPQAILVSPTR